MIFDAAQKPRKTTISITTMLAPTGVPFIIENNIPKTEQTTDKTAEQITTCLKLLNMRIADSAGNTINADTKSEPTRFIASTIITAVIIAIIKLYLLTFIPVAFANVSSKVTANILL